MSRDAIRFEIREHEKKARKENEELQAVLRARRKERLLRAAAPELLAELKTAVQIIQSVAFRPATLERMKAVIAKAEGENK